MNFIFPQYRKLSNGQSYYKIEAPDTLTEIQRVGSRWTLHVLKAKILPERNLIADILQNEGGRYLIIDKDEYESFADDCHKNLTQFRTDN